MWEEATMTRSSAREIAVHLAFALGFSNRTHFYRLFEKKFGQSPSDYRKSR